VVWDIFWLMLCFFYFAAYLYIVIVIITDLFRDHGLNGWAKAVWILALLLFPFLTALVYVIARHKGMAQRWSAARGQAPEVDDYKPTASRTPTEDIAQAKALLDQGAISQGEFEAITSKALGNQYFGA
jgi:type VI protein secretion system component VasK